jgi:O-antigen/teichoic acid export membrane protein
MSVLALSTRRLGARVRSAPLARSSFALTVSRGVSGALVMLASVLVARAAGASTLGIFGLALTVGVYASTVADTGVSQYLLPATGLTARDRWPELWANAWRFAVRSTIPLLAVYLGAVTVLTHGSERLALQAAAAWWLLVRTSGYARPFFVAAARVGIEATATVLEATLALVAIAAFLLVSHSAALATVGLATGAGAGLAVRLRGLRSLGVTGGSATQGTQALVRSTAPFAMFSVLTVLYLRIDVVLLAALKSSHELGLYQAPVRLVTALLILPDALAAVLLTRAARTLGRTGSEIREEQVLTFGIPLGLLLAGLCAVAGRQILGLTYGPDFRQAWLALALLTATVPLALLTAMNGNALTVRGHQWPRVACLCAASVCAVGLGIPAIARFGYEGAAAVSVVNELVLTLAYALALRALCGRDAILLPRARLLFRGRPIRPPAARP